MKSWKIFFTRNFSLKNLIGWCVRWEIGWTGGPVRLNRSKSKTVWNPSSSGRSYSVTQKVKFCKKNSKQILRFRLKIEFHIPSQNKIFTVLKLPIHYLVHMTENHCQNSGNDLFKLTFNLQTLQIPYKYKTYK